MLPGCVSELYKTEDLSILLFPLATWCNADFVQQRVTKIEGASNKIILEDGSTLDYDFLAINIGSKTRDTNNVPGVWEHALTTRPINNLMPKIEKKEQ
jgi:selenide, water dikinase